MDWTLAGAVILSGIVIVFLILVILIIMVNAIGAFSGSKQKPQVKATPAATPAAAPAPAAAPVPVVQAGISGETVAAISAAVTAIAEEQGPGVAYMVTDIQHAQAPAQQSRASRPAWGFAGMQQNTRPF